MPEKYEYKTVVPTEYNLNNAAAEGYRFVSMINWPNHAHSLAHTPPEAVMERVITAPEPDKSGLGPAALYTIGEAAWLQVDEVARCLPAYLQKRLTSQEWQIMSDIGTLMSDYLTTPDARDRKTAWTVALENACAHYANDNPPTIEETGQVTMDLKALEGGSIE